jgi:hypothetical protein
MAPVEDCDIWGAPQMTISQLRQTQVKDSYAVFYLYGHLF